MPHPHWPARRNGPRSSLLVTLGAFTAATLATYLLGRLLPAATVAAWLYLPFVLLVTIRWGLAPGIGAALLADLLVLFIAIEPLGTLAASERGDYLRLAIAAAGLIAAAIFVALLHQRSLAVERAMATQSERARALDAREQFLAAVSHDLRTPLTSMHTGTEFLSRALSHMDTPQQGLLAVSLTEMERAVRSMNRMIDDLLDLSRIEAGRPLELHRERIDLVRLARRVAEECQHGTNVHRVIVATSTEELVGAWSVSQLERALCNLLSNAVKYSPGGGRVLVTIAIVDVEGEKGRWAEVRVKDEGIGIPAGDLPHIFERFHRARNVSGRMPGLGIGLAGVKQIVEQHGGSISLESEEGRGSAFIVRLPRGEVDEATPL